MGVMALWKLISEVTSTFPVFLVRSKSQALPMPKGEVCTDVNPGGRTLGAAEGSIPHWCALSRGAGVGGSTSEGRPQTQDSDQTSVVTNQTD